jgi:DNA repair photolyase
MTETKSVIYRPAGRALEYSELALNLFSGCGHRCAYCYAPMIAHRKPEDFFGNPKPRVTLGEIERSANYWAVRELPRLNRRPNVLLCFTSDPYQPCEADSKLTRKAIEILHGASVSVTILTKAGMRAMRDFDLLGPGDVFATTLTCSNNENSLEWEPGAALPGERLHSLSEAHKRGIRTWVSLEPVLFPAQTMWLIQATLGYVDEYRVGMLNYHKHSDTVDWKVFGWEIKALLDRLGVKYMIKHDLALAMGLKEAGGSAAPAHRSQITVPHALRQAGR